ncbi:MAG TPA: nucleotidyl transferase AbiEii/AbiGii toxin family protein [Puia sp.]|nr:nucleotidyl transferase AbiEii/AbiGii toxin family protein [Puia sp.]
MIREWLDTYHPKDNASAEQALREIMQEIALAGLERAGFFEKAAFYGGTALRIFYKLPRFSEDLDFSLLARDDRFSLQSYLDRMQEEFEALGMRVSVTEKKKTKQTAVDSAFLKADTTWKELILQGVIPQEKLGLRPEIKIKIEVDTHPPKGFSTEEKLMIRPYSFYVKCFSLPDLFAGKMHALLFRKWRDRVKGRDWFDLEWYIRKGVPLHLEHFKARAQDSGDWKEKKISREQLIALLEAKIRDVSFSRIKEDIIKFIPDDKTVSIWSAKYFIDLIRHLKFC